MLGELGDGSIKVIYKHKFFIKKILHLIHKKTLKWKYQLKLSRLLKMIN